MINIINPKRPNNAAWVRCPPPPKWASLGFPAESWAHPDSRLCVISAVEVAMDADGIDRGPEYHISMSLQSLQGDIERCTSADALWILAQFDVLDAEEDNHVHGGKVRNWWRPVADRLVGLKCGCKEAEPAMRENKGDYVWRGAN